VLHEGTRVHSSNRCLFRTNGLRLLKRRPASGRTRRGCASPRPWSFAGDGVPCLQDGPSCIGRRAHTPAAGFGFQGEVRTTALSVRPPDGEGGVRVARSTPGPHWPRHAAVRNAWAAFPGATRAAEVRDPVMIALAALLTLTLAAMLVACEDPLIYQACPAIPESAPQG
jgi:hypothetical protein